MKNVKPAAHNSASSTPRQSAEVIPLFPAQDGHAFNLHLYDFHRPLGAIFGRDYKGAITLRSYMGLDPVAKVGAESNTATLDCLDVNGHARFIESAPTQVWCELDLDGQFGLTLVFRDKDRAYAAAAKLNPSFVSVNKKTGATYLTYLFTDDADDVAALAAELMEGDTDDAYTSLGFPLAYGAISLSRGDLAGAKAGKEFNGGTTAEFIAAFFGGGDDGAGELPEGLEGSAETVPESSAEADDHFIMPDGRRFDVTTTERGKVGGFFTERWNDAEVYGELDESLLDTVIQFSHGKYREDKKWKTTKADKVRFFLDSLTRHVAGDKGGTCFVPGALAGPQRTNNAVTKMCLMGIDVDSGESLVETARKIQDAGWMALLYTTHSHGTPQLEIKQDKFFKWASNNGHGTVPTVDTVKDFLRDEGKYVPDVIESVYAVAEDHLTTGVQVIARTRPIDKFRIVFPLASEYVLSKQGMAQKDAIKQWGDMILGMARRLDIYADRGARDCSRLFYYPRNHKKRALLKRVIVVAGRALDWRNDITPVSIRDSRINDPFEQAVHDMGGSASERPITPGGADLKTWAVKNAHAFEISKVFAEYCPELRKDETSPGKFTVTCPFDEDHSNAGDEDDKGCFICDAGMDHETFAFRCSHDSCSGRDRLAMLNKMFVDGIIPESILTDDSYYCDRDDPVEDAPVADIEKTVIYRTDDFDVQHRSIRQALETANNPPTIFRHAGVLKQINRGEGGAFLDLLTNPQFTTAANEALTCHKESPKKGKKNRKCSLPKDAVAHVWGQKGTWAPEIVRISPIPVLAKVGSFRLERGFDNATGVFIDMPEGVKITLPDKVTEADLDKEFGLLEETFGQFPFTDNWSGAGDDDTGDSSWSHFLAMLLTPLIREVYSGPTPLFAIDKPLAGTGATKLASGWHAVVMGKNPPPSPYPALEEEVRKKVGAVVEAGRSVLLFDNVARMVNSESIAILATSTGWEDRRLGKSELISAPIRCTTIFTGNNLKFSAENARRVLPIRIDAHSVDPTKNRTFKHDPLEEWIEAQRWPLVRALLVILKYWVQEGMPVDKDARLASFEGYTTVMGGILKSIGVGGFLANLGSFNATAVTERDETKEWVHAIFAHVRAQDIAHDFKAMEAIEAIWDTNGYGDLKYPVLKIDAEDIPGRARMLGFRLNSINGRQFIVGGEDGTEVEVRFSKRDAAREGSNVYQFTLVQPKPEVQ